MAQQVKCLLCMNKDLNYDPQKTHVKNWVSWYAVGWSLKRILAGQWQNVSLIFILWTAGNVAIWSCDSMKEASEHRAQGHWGQFLLLFVKGQRDRTATGHNALTTEQAGLVR